MNDFVTQMVCGARGFDIEDNGWVQLLVFVIMAVIYAIGSIAKMKKGKTEEGKESAPQLSGESKKGGRPEKQQITKGRSRIVSVSDRRPKITSVDVTKVQPAPIPMGKQIIELAKSSSEMETKGILMPSEVPVPIYLTEILSDYADPEKVRKVILHYEILGKPLSLRESPENIIGS